MHQRLFDVEDWYKALTLTERVESLDKCQFQSFNVELADKRLQRWQSQAPFTSDTDFRMRLATDGLDISKFRYILGEAPLILQQRIKFPPAWLKEVEQAFEINSPKIKVIPPAQIPPGKEYFGFLYAIEPLVSQGIECLETGVEALLRKYTQVPFEASQIKSLLFTLLPEQLLAILTPTMVLELNIARLQEILVGETPQQRFLSFLEGLYERERTQALLCEYPVLARQLLICISKWVNFSLEFLQHLCADWEDICSTFSPLESPGVLVGLKGNLSDSHRGGRSVLIAQFSYGLQVVYKPKPLAVDIHFQELLTWLNEKGNYLPFPILKILNRAHYGWVEFINAQSCSSTVEIERFYQRLGGYLALLYALEATDFHSENLIAAGENPVLIDLESLFHPRYTPNQETSSTWLGWEEMTYSVLRVGLLPQRLWANNQSEGVDISGMGGNAGQILPNHITAWQGEATDKMHVARRLGVLEASENQPRLIDKVVNVLDYASAITQGFNNIYQLLLQHKDELQVFLTRFISDEVRVVLRPTRTYTLLLQESFHPDLLQNALERERHFDRLWLAVQHQSYLAQVIVYERACLWQGDIPIFTTRPNSSDLYCGDENCIPNFFAKSGWELVTRRLQKLCEQDKERQLWFIRASLSTLGCSEEAASWKGYRIFTPQIIPQREQLLETACKVGDRLEFLALRHFEEATWIGLTLVGGKHWSLSPLSWTLYDGLPGVALFLAYLGQITQEARYTQLAQAALRALQNQLKRDKSQIKLIGAFSGWGGIIYTLTHLGALWQQPELLALAARWVKECQNLISQDKYFDIIDGVAGYIPCLLGLYQYIQEDWILEAAIACGEKLFEFKPAGTGFAHGTPGIAWALLELATATSISQFRERARTLIINENRYENNASNFTNEVATWCNGAPGQGLAHVRYLRNFVDVDISKEIDIMLQTTLKQGFGLNHCLCHGDLGNLELLLQMHEHTSKNCDKEIQLITAMIWESINQNGYLSGVPLGVETPGLMTGISGIGYGLLRLVAPEEIPAVVMLAPPHKKFDVSKKLI